MEDLGCRVRGPYTASAGSLRDSGVEVEVLQAPAALHPG